MPQRSAPWRRESAMQAGALATHELLKGLDFRVVEPEPDDGALPDLLARFRVEVWFGVQDRDVDTRAAWRCRQVIVGPHTDRDAERPPPGLIARPRWAPIEQCKFLKDQ